MNILDNPHIVFEYAGLFTQDGDWTHPARTETTYELIYVTEGEVCLRIDGRAGEVRVGKGELILLEPGVLHEGSRVTRGVSFYWAHFHVKDGALPFRMRFFEKFAYAYLFKELLHASFLPLTEPYYANSVLIRILAELCREAEAGEDGGDKTAGEIYEYIRAAISATITVKKVAEHFALSPDHVSRVLKRRYGLGARAIIDKLLLAASKEKLADTGASVKQIAFALDFPSDGAFSTFFRYHEGSTPSAFRARYYKTHMNVR